MVKVRERLAVSKRTTERVHMERFNLKKLNDVKGKESIVLKSQIGSNLWKTKMMRWILIELWKLYRETISK
jgi:hypothetical protein